MKKVSTELQQLIEDLKMVEALRNYIDSIIQGMDHFPPPLKIKIKDILWENAKDKYIKEVIDIFQTHFTEDEIRNLYGFFGSDIGIKYVKMCENVETWFKKFDKQLLINSKAQIDKEYDEFYSDIDYDTGASYDNMDISDYPPIF